MRVAGDPMPSNQPPFQAPQSRSILQYNTLLPCASQVTPDFNLSGVGLVCLALLADALIGSVQALYYYYFILYYIIL